MVINHYDANVSGVTSSLHLAHKKYSHFAKCMLRTIPIIAAASPRRVQGPVNGMVRAEPCSATRSDNLFAETMGWNLSATTLTSCSSRNCSVDYGLDTMVVKQS